MCANFDVFCGLLRSNGFDCAVVVAFFKWNNQTKKVVAFLIDLKKYLTFFSCLILILRLIWVNIGWVDQNWIGYNSHLGELLDKIIWIFCLLEPEKEQYFKHAEQAFLLLLFHNIVCKVCLFRWKRADLCFLAQLSSWNSSTSSDNTPHANYIDKVYLRGRWVYNTMIHVNIKQ